MMHYKGLLAATDMLDPDLNRLEDYVFIKKKSNTIPLVRGLLSYHHKINEKNITRTILF